MKTTPVLMSPENPDGWKLEELCETLVSEIDRKCRKIENDTRPEAGFVLSNNHSIKVYLQEIRSLQLSSLAKLETLGPYPGASGTPRIGAGSDGFDVCGPQPKFT